MSDRRPKPVDPDDAAAWDAFVAGADPGSYLQLSPWAAVKAVNGWSTVRLARGVAQRRQIGAQVLVRRPRPLPWALRLRPARPGRHGLVTGHDADRSPRSPRRAARPSGPRPAGSPTSGSTPRSSDDGPHDDGGALRRALRAAGLRPAAADPAERHPDHRPARRRGRRSGATSARSGAST